MYKLKKRTKQHERNFIRLDNKSIHYKTNLYSTELPSYPKGRSYLDICLADARLKFQNLRPISTLRTLDYDSDHNAIVFQINKNTSDYLTLKTVRNTQVQLQKDRLEKVPKPTRTELRSKNL